MADNITYYAITNLAKNLDKPRGLARRLEHKDGPEDEMLRRDFSWVGTGIIAEWEHGSFDSELVEVSHEQASEIIDYFREQWGPHGQKP